MRSKIRNIVPDLIVWGTRNFDRTNELFRLTWIPKPTERIVIMLGSRTYNGLRAFTSFMDSRFDDQIAILTRSFVEIALDIAYLQHGTTRLVKRGSGDVKAYVLSVEDKAEIFNGYKLVQKNRIGSKFTLADKPRLDQVLAFRKSKGIASQGSWHGSTMNQVLDELRAIVVSNSPRVRRADLLEVDFERLAQIHDLFRQFSFLTHTNPYEQFYFEWVHLDFGPRMQLKAGVTVDEFFWISLMAVIEVFLQWNLAIAPIDHHEDVFGMAVDLLRRLPEARRAES